MVKEGNSVSFYQVESILHFTSQENTSNAKMPFSLKIS